jgi:hypothetical protein
MIVEIKELTTKRNLYDEDFLIAINAIIIPEKIYLKAADKFDDKHIISTGDRWLFDYSGSRRYVYFSLDLPSNILIKYICFKYASTRMATRLPGLARSWEKAIKYCELNGAFSLSVLRTYCESKGITSWSFYDILFGLKIFCTEEFPGFSLSDYDELEFISRPSANGWGIYQEIDNILSPLEKNMITNGLFEMASLIAMDNFNYPLNYVLDAAILGLVYATGARPVQIAKLAAKDIRIDTRDTKSGLIRYSVLMPYAKQGNLVIERLYLALPPEIGQILIYYISKKLLLPEDKLFDTGVSSPIYISKALNRCIIEFSPQDYKRALARGEAAAPIITPTDLRHNVGHSLAMQGVSAEEIAHILGQSSLVVAKHYILATPSLALVRAKVLGVNPVWQNMVAMMLTGELVKNSDWHGKRVAGVIGNTLLSEIGGCSKTHSNCIFSEVRSCYGCLYYRPFSDGNHEHVLQSIYTEIDEIVELSDSVGNARNPIIKIHEITILEVNSVIARCAIQKRKSCE